MFSASKLTPEQKETLIRWAAEGATMSDLQKGMRTEFGLSVTYMDTRFLVLDLGIELQTEPKAPEKPLEEPEPLPTEAEIGAVVATMDHIAIPGALASGKVTFSDGQTGIWIIDQQGRPSLDPDTEGYRPSQEDIMEFQVQLRELIQRSGL